MRPFDGCKKKRNKPWRKQGWVIPPEQNSDFVAHMERVLDIYKRPYDPKVPVICMDESPKQLIRETRISIRARPGSLEKYGYEYERCGVCNIFMANEHLAGIRYVKVTERRTKLDWAAFIKDIYDTYQEADKITLVMDNLNRNYLHAANGGGMGKEGDRMNAILAGCGFNFRKALRAILFVPDFIQAKIDQLGQVIRNIDPGYKAVQLQAA